MRCFLFLPGRGCCSCSQSSASLAAACSAARRLAAWAQENGYKLNDKGVWAKGTGMLTSATEIRFEGGDMLVQECVNLLFLINRFAINAPILVGKPVRMMKIRALNKLMAQWHLPEIVFDSPESKIRIKK